MSITLREAAEEAWMWLVSEWADDFEARHVAASYKAEAIEHLRLALDADPEEPLDVERLARAIKNITEYESSGHGRSPRKMWRNVPFTAAALAAAYDAEPDA